MREVRLLDSLAAAVRRWQRYRAQCRLFTRWLKAGRIDLQDYTDLTNHPAAMVRMAVIRGSDEVVFVPRHLHGLRSFETRDEFWALNPPPQSEAEVAALARNPENFLPEGILYLQRFGQFDRIDEYHIRDNVSMLAGGFPCVLEDMLAVFRDALSRPWSMEVVNAGEISLRGATVRVELSSPARLGFRLTYSN